MKLLRKFAEMYYFAAKATSGQSFVSVAIEKVFKTIIILSAKPSYNLFFSEFSTLFLKLIFSYDMLTALFTEH